VEGKDEQGDKGDHSDSSSSSSENESRSGTPEKPDKLDRADKADKSDRGEKGGKREKADKAGQEKKAGNNENITPPQKPGKGALRADNGGSGTEDDEDGKDSGDDSGGDSGSDSESDESSDEEPEQKKGYSTLKPGEAEDADSKELRIPDVMADRPLEIIALSLVVFMIMLIAVGLDLYKSIDGSIAYIDPEHMQMAQVSLGLSVAGS
jgi:hypothetical protein